jgi:hypothetical protein
MAAEFGTYRRSGSKCACSKSYTPTIAPWPGTSPRADVQFRRSIASYFCRRAEQFLKQADRANDARPDPDLIITTNINTEEHKMTAWYLL